MAILSIEPTPSPNTMKINITEQLPAGAGHTYMRENPEEAPTPELRQLLGIEGVRSLYRAADFIALDRHPKGDWGHILAEAREILGESGPAAGTSSSAAGAAGDPSVPEADDSSAAAFGEVKVSLQHFRGIPLQIRVTDGSEEKRAALPQRFSDAAIRAAAAAPNLIKERTLEEWDTRYGELQEVLDGIVQELDASYTDEQLDELASQASSGPSAGTARSLAAAGQTVLSREELERQLQSTEWKERYAALQRIQPSPDTLPLLLLGLRDEHTAVRRLAAVYIGDLKDPLVLPYLFEALQDSSPSVRRTAGDTLSDLGDPAAQPAMMDALRDSNKLVRWRAARFLYEAGDEQALPALQAAAADPEFEVRMQVRMALERIEGGSAAEGSVWQQMSRRSNT